MISVAQMPLPGTSRVLFRGDCLRFTLTLNKNAAGNAWVRTNLGTAAIARQEIIDRVEKNEIKLHVHPFAAAASDRIFSGQMFFHS